MKRTIELTIETARRWYAGQAEELKQLAIQTFPELAVKELPKSWEELGGVEGYYVTSMAGVDETNFGKNTFKTKEQAEASIALAQLSQLRDVYRGDWKPTKEVYKHCIVILPDKLMTIKFSCMDKFLSFQDSETAELFLERFRTLIEQAKPLMS